MNRLRELRCERGMTQEELGSLIGVKKAAISKYESGRVTLPPEMLLRICDYFLVSADYLLGRPASHEATPIWKAKSQPFIEPAANVVGVPLVGRVHAGTPILADENISEYIPVQSGEIASGDYFFMEVEGDCMENAHIPEGSLILVRIQPRVDNGQIAVIRVEDEVLLRSVKWAQSHMVLIPANPKYEPMVIQSGDVEIVGRVVEARIRGL